MKRLLDVTQPERVGEGTVPVILEEVGTEETTLPTPAVVQVFVGSEKDHPVVVVLMTTHTSVDGVLRGPLLTTP